MSAFELDEYLQSVHVAVFVLYKKHATHSPVRRTRIPEIRIPDMFSEWRMPAERIMMHDPVQHWEPL